MNIFFALSKYFKSAKTKKTIRININKRLEKLLEQIKK